MISFWQYYLKPYNFKVFNIILRVLRMTWPVEMIRNWMVFFLGYVPSVVLDSVTKSSFGLSYIEKVSMFPAQKFVRDSLSIAVNWSSDLPFSSSPVVSMTSGFFTHPAQLAAFITAFVPICFPWRFSTLFRRSRAVGVDNILNMIQPLSQTVQTVSNPENSFTGENRPS